MILLVKSRIIKIYTACHSVFDVRLKTPLFTSVDMSKMERSTSKTQGRKGLDRSESPSPAFNMHNKYFNVQCSVWNVFGDLS